MRDRTFARRYPAFGVVAAAGMLVTLLPSALRLPLSGPSAAAELAPVPGKSDAAQGDLNSLGSSSTGGLGSGDRGDGSTPGSGQPGGDAEDGSGGPSGRGENPRNKLCVGSPPRQTEDPLSPVCVGFFRGDNGGATAKGVTPTEIRVVVLGNCRSDGSFDIIDYEDEEHEEEVEAAYIGYFNERFQTYGRKVRLFKADAPESSSACFNQGRTVMQRVDELLEPFLIYNFETTDGISEELADEAARLGIVSIMAGPFRKVSQRLAPYAISYGSDLDELIEHTAEAVCARLAGGVARYAGDPTMQGTRRKFGLSYWRRAQDAAGAGAEVLVSAIARRCGPRAGPVTAYDVNGKPAYSESVARMRFEGVTTLIAIDPPINLFTTAEAAKWYPEFLVTSDFLVGSNLHMSLNAPLVRSAFGLMDRRRLGPPAVQHHRQAYAEGCPDCTGPTYEGTYNQLFLVFSAIQAAGPRLTAANVDIGLHALPARQSKDPFVPAAYFAPGNYSFVKDMAFAWWDRSGRPPGSSSVGCWRLVEEGLRYRVPDWATRPGDEGLREPDHPCQGDDQ